MSSSSPQDNDKDRHGKKLRPKVFHPKRVDVSSLANATGSHIDDSDHFRQPLHVFEALRITKQFNSIKKHGNRCFLGYPRHCHESWPAARCLPTLAVDAPHVSPQGWASKWGRNFQTNESGVISPNEIPRRSNDKPKHI